MTLHRHDFRHFDRLRVRWAEVDMQKIVFNGHYLAYADAAVAGYWRSLAAPYHDTMAQMQGDIFVRKATVDFLGSARYDDLLDIGVRCGTIGKSSMPFTAAIFRGEQLLVSVELLYVFADPVSQTSRPVPQALRDLMQSFEKGEPMFHLSLGSWVELGAAAAPLRDAVFVQEQGINADLVHDEADGRAVHALLRNRLGQPLATGRLIELTGDDWAAASHPDAVFVPVPAHGPAGDGDRDSRTAHISSANSADSMGRIGPIGRIGRIGRMAVVQSLRNAGLGGALLQALTDAARERGFEALSLQAQLCAVPFYRRAGFVKQGGVFEAAGITHQTMFKRL